MMHPSGILLIGHGARDPHGQAEFRRLVERTAEGVAKQGSDAPAVEGCCLELVEPDIHQGLCRLAARGVQRVTAVPALLFAAGHARRDIPRAIAQAVVQIRTETPGAFAEIRQTEPLECAPDVLALSARRFREALAGRAEIPAAETCWVLASRGSSDPDTPGALRQFAQARHPETFCGAVELGFVAAARPSLAEALAAAARSTASRVVVQPHLLFRGQVLEEVRAAVDRAALASRGKEWIVAEALGPEAELVRAILAKAGIETRDEGLVSG